MLKVKDMATGEMQALLRVGFGHRPPVINIAGREPQREQFAAVVNDQVEFEAIELVLAGFTASGAPSKVSCVPSAAKSVETHSGMIVFQPCGTR